METLAKTTQKVKLVDGVFTLSEANDVVQALLDEKINFHKLQRLAWCEGDCGADTKFPDGRIKELMEAQTSMREFIDAIRHEGKNVRIDGVLKIELVD